MLKLTFKLLVHWYVLSSSDILYTLYPYFTIRMTNIMSQSKTVLNHMLVMFTYMYIG